MCIPKPKAKVVPPRFSARGGSWQRPHSAPRGDITPGKSFYCRAGNKNVTFVRDNKITKQTTHIALMVVRPDNCRCSSNSRSDSHWLSCHYYQPMPNQILTIIFFWLSSIVDNCDHDQIYSSTFFLIFGWTTWNCGEQPKCTCVGCPPDNQYFEPYFQACIVPLHHSVKSHFIAHTEWQKPLLSSGGGGGDFRIPPPTQTFLGKLWPCTQYREPRFLLDLF